MYWNWRMVVEHELGKYCMSVQDQVATIHHTLNTTIRTNLHASAVPAKTKYARGILEIARQRQGEAAITFFSRLV